MQNLPEAFDLLLRVVSSLKEAAHKKYGDTNDVKKIRNLERHIQDLRVDIIDEAGMIVRQRSQKTIKRRLRRMDERNRAIQAKRKESKTSTAKA